MKCTCGHRWEEHDMVGDASRVAQGDCTVYDDVTGEWCRCYVYKEEKNP